MNTPVSQSEVRKREDVDEVPTNKTLSEKKIIVTRGLKELSAMTSRTSRPSGQKSHYFGVTVQWKMGLRSLSQPLPKI